MTEPGHLRREFRLRRTLFWSYCMVPRCILVERRSRYSSSQRSFPLLAQSEDNSVSSMCEGRSEVIVEFLIIGTQSQLKWLSALSRTNPPVEPGSNAFAKTAPACGRFRNACKVAFDMTFVCGRFSWAFQQRSTTSAYRCVVLNQ